MREYAKLRCALPFLSVSFFSKFNRTKFVEEISLCENTGSEQIHTFNLNVRLDNDSQTHRGIFKGKKAE